MERALDRPVGLAVGVTVLAAAFVVARLAVVAHGDITRFIDVGSAFAQVHHVPHGIAIVPGGGYDGQFYYRLALDPANLHRTAYGITLDNGYRIQRITYPVLAWLLAAGQQAAVPYSLVAVNVVALGALAWLAALLARDCGRRPAWGLLVAGYFGFLFSLGRDLTEICEACFVVAGLLSLRRGRPVWAGLALAAAVLSRETALVVVAGVALVAVRDVVRGRRRPVRADLAFFLPVALYAAWQAIGWAVFGSIPIGSDGENNLTYPFVSMAQAVAEQSRSAAVGTCGRVAGRAGGAGHAGGGGRPHAAAVAGPAGGEMGLGGGGVAGRLLDEDALGKPRRLPRLRGPLPAVRGRAARFGAGPAGSWPCSSASCGRSRSSTAWCTSDPAGSGATRSCGPAGPWWSCQTRPTRRPYIASSGKRLTQFVCIEAPSATIVDPHT